MRLQIANTKENKRSIRLSHWKKETVLKCEMRAYILVLIREDCKERRKLQAAQAIMNKVNMRIAGCRMNYKFRNNYCTSTVNL